MALIRYAEGQQRSGSIGATVYSHNRFGQYMRARSVPVNPQSSRQVAARNRLQSLAGNWSETLTDSQREAWRSYAQTVSWLNPLGDVVTLTGINMYCRGNTAVLQAGGTRIDDGPAASGLPTAEQSLGASGSEATQVISVTFDDTAAWCDLDDAFQLLYMGIPVSPAIQFFNGPWRYIEAIAGDSAAPPSSPHACTAGNTPFPFQEGQQIFIQSRILLPDGRLSTTARTSFLAGA